jgi:hypothetical protein
MHAPLRCGVTVVLVCLHLLVPAAAMEVAPVNVAGDDTSLRQSLGVVAQALDADVRAVLDDIEGTPRRLLALRAYLRAGSALRGRWSWTEAQARDFKRSAGYQRMLADVQRVTQEFEALNPGFTLYANTEVRSLGVQLERWNKNRTVGLLADELSAELRAATATSAAVAGPVQLRRWLIDWQPAAAVPLAAPGLSLHGRGQALDFQVRQGDRIIAGTDTATASKDWDAAGWTEKLQRAVQRSGMPFRGPLQVPREPWHYEYQPETPAIDSQSGDG